MKPALEVLKKIAENEGLTITALEKILGASKGVFSRAINKNTDIQSKWLYSLVENFPQYSPEWILTQHGEMKIINHQVAEPKAIYSKRSERKIDQTIPLYHLEASAGLVPLLDHPSQFKTDDYISIPNLPKCDGAIFVTGDSMYPILKSGDIVAYKKIEDIKNEIFWGEMYLISVEVSGEEYISCKYIQKSEKGDEFLKLVSHNKHHQDKNVSLKKVRALAIIKASIRINSIQ